MENGTDFRDIIRALWRGKYFILSMVLLCALAGYFLITPKYESRVVINVTPFDYTVREIMRIIDVEGIIFNAAAEAGKEDLRAFESVRCEDLTTGPAGHAQKLISITARHENPEKSAEVARWSATVLFEAIAEEQRRILYGEKERLNNKISFMDEEFNGEDNTAYREARGILLVELNEVMFRLEELEAGISADTQVYPAVTGSDSQVARMKLNNMIMAAMLGLVLSSGAVYLRHLYITAEAKEAEAETKNING